MAKRKTPKPKAPKPSPELPPGYIEVETFPGSKDNIQLDAIQVMRAAEVLYDECGMKEENNELRPTAVFMSKLSNTLNECGYETTPSNATEAWIKASDWVINAQKKTN